MKTIAIGGHFLMYDTLPQSLLTRRLERLTDHVATNASHPAVDRHLSRMALALTTMPGKKRSSSCYSSWLALTPHSSWNVAVHRAVRIGVARSCTLSD